MRFVLDASVALAWFIDRSVPPYALRVRQLLIRGDVAIVPALWPLDLANGFLSSERRGLLKQSDLTQMLQELDVLLRSIEIAPDVPSVRRIVTAGRVSHLTAYDAAYLELAREQRVSLATLDQSLAQAAKAADVPLVG